MSLERLILIRHGKAEGRSASGEDFDRALTERGRVESRATGARLAERGLVPDLALVSAARRTVETWDTLSQTFPNARAEIVKALYLAEPDTLLRTALAAEAEAVALVGHNPGMHALAYRLITGGLAEAGIVRRIGAGLPTASAVVIRFEGGRAVCEAMFTPRDGAGA